MKNDYKVEEYEQLETSKMIEELLKGGLKKGEFVGLFARTGKGVSILDKRQNNG